MDPDDFFFDCYVEDWDLRGLSQDRAVERKLKTDLVAGLRTSAQPGVNDVEAAYGLARLAQRELTAYGTARDEVLSEDEIALVLRALRGVLGRFGIPFNPPFRDFRGFHGYWRQEGMSGAGGWGARSGYVNSLFEPVFTALDEREENLVRRQSMRGVDGEIKNIIFASIGPKPRIVFVDAMNNQIKVERHEESCLVYDQPLDESGLTWGQLVSWWRTKTSQGERTDHEVGQDLYRRLARSVAPDSPPEMTLFRTYCARYAEADAAAIPALLPQVYLHYDPYTRRERGADGSTIKRERMDFLLLLPGRIRVVLEVDGDQHYSQDGKPSPRLYSEMMAEDRKLRLTGYEVYRFGGHELRRPDAKDLLQKFFAELLAKHRF